MRVLAVEDDPALADLLRRRLWREGHVVDVAPDGASGLERAEGRSYANAPDRGAIFTVMLPLARRGPSSARMPDDPFVIVSSCTRPILGRKASAPPLTVPRATDADAMPEGQCSR
jgi:CheY-like chemotaxis protein